MSHPRHPPNLRDRARVSSRGPGPRLRKEEHKTKGRGPSCAGLRLFWWWAAINHSFGGCIAPPSPRKVSPSRPGPRPYYPPPSRARSSSSMAKQPQPFLFLLLSPYGVGLTQAIVVKLLEQIAHLALRLQPAEEPA